MSPTIGTGEGLALAGRAVVPRMVAAAAAAIALRPIWRETGLGLRGVIMARRYAARHLLQIPHDAPPSLARVGFPDLVAPPPVGASSSPQVIAAVDHDPYREQMANPPETAFRQWVGSPWADVALAAGLTLAGQLELLSAEHDGLAQGMALLVQTAPVAIRRSHTVLAAGVGALALTVEATLLDPTNTLAGLVAGLVLVYSVGRHLRRRALFAMTAFMFLAIVAHTAALPRSGTGAEDVAFAALFSAVAWGLGRGGQRRADTTAAAARLAELTKAEHAAQLASVVVEERTRIAREMHDVVAHSMSVMVVQAAAAEHLIAEDPDQARAPLATVRETGQQSLAEMRRLLGLLRTGPPLASEDDSGLQPTLAQVPALVATLQETGMLVTLSRIDTGSVDLPPGLDLCAFRIVQESLTNALRHGRGAPTTVRVVISPSAVDLTVATVGPGDIVGDNPAGDRNTGVPTGHGLIGMRERVAVYDGTLITEPQPDGGFLVHAHLPVPG